MEPCWKKNYIRVGRALRVCNVAQLPVPLCCFLCAVENVVSQLSAPGAIPCLSCYDGLCPSETISQDKLFLPLSCIGHGILLQQQKVINRGSKETSGRVNITKVKMLKMIDT